jgi:mannose/cellobiose epimerase-like protein (N-acyl-D-glucosamine 2-epimerase family)
MGMVDEIYNAAFYRHQADVARESAARASTPGHREEFLRLAAEWDRLADAEEGLDEGL